jgi:hypothetical protein
MALWISIAISFDERRTRFARHNHLPEGITPRRDFLDLVLISEA